MDDTTTPPGREEGLIDEAIRSAEQRLAEQEQREERARRRAAQLAREQAYHRLAAAIDRPARRRVSPNQLSFFPTDDPTLFDET